MLARLPIPMLNSNVVAENASNGTDGRHRLPSRVDNDGTNNTIAYSLDDDRRRTLHDRPGLRSGVRCQRFSCSIARAAGFHAITVRATSADGSFSTQGFVINLTDVDEFNVGGISDTDPTTDSTAENAANGTVVGIAAFASDADATNSTVNYSLDDDAGGRFSIDAATGLVRVANGTLLDREAAADHDIVVRATSADGSFSVRAFTVDLTDLDEFDVGPVSDIDGLANSVDEGPPTERLSAFRRLPVTVMRPTTPSPMGSTMMPAVGLRSIQQVASCALPTVCCLIARRRPSIPS